MKIITHQMRIQVNDRANDQIKNYVNDQVKDTLLIEIWFQVRGQIKDETNK